MAFIELVQRVYHPGAVTQGPVTGRHFTGWHKVTRYDEDGTLLSRFWLPPGVCLDSTEGDGFELTQMRYGSANHLGGGVESEAIRPLRGTVLYGTDVHYNMKNVLRQARLLESREGAGNTD